MMKDFMTSGMTAALRLTRQGRLKAAVAALTGELDLESLARPRKLGLSSFEGRPISLPSVLEKLGQLSRSPLLGGLPGLGPKSRPSSPREGSRFEERVFSNAAGSRNYKLFVPGSYNGKPLPLVMMLHGCTQSPDDFAAGTRMNEIAEEKGFFVAYPAQAGSANISRCWNWFKPNDQERDRGEPSILAGITREIRDKFNLRPGCNFIAGLSAGGATAAIMGAAYPELFAAVGVHSGLAKGAAHDLPSAMLAMRNGGIPAEIRNRDLQARVTPTIVFHGDRDTTVNIANAEQVIRQAKGDARLRTEVERASAAGVEYTCYVQMTADDQPVLEEWVLHGGGHAWSGGSAAGSFTQPKGPDASREMIRFFFQLRA
jgi:poly(hydroxyalkanoate) depolymerase family esterase